MKFLMRIIISAFAVVITAYVLPGVQVDTFLTALMVAALISVLNIFLRPVLIILTIPITFLTLGLFLLFINAFIIMVVSRLADGFSVNNIWWALLFSICLSIVVTVLESLNSAFDKK